MALGAARAVAIRKERMKVFILNSFAEMVEKDRIDKMD
jgi:hypothetical protein